MCEERRTAVEQDSSPSGHCRKPRHRKLWLWFVAGFAIVFIGMVLSVKMHMVLPSGEGVLQCRLWRYYIIEIHRAMGPRHIGPTTGSTFAAFQTGLFHVLLSVLGGLAMTAIGWCIRRTKALDVSIMSWK
jgi:hypothetical protein